MPATIPSASVVFPYIKIRRLIPYLIRRHRHSAEGCRHPSAISCESGRIEWIRIKLVLSEKQQNHLHIRRSDFVCYPSHLRVETILPLRCFIVGPFARRPYDNLYSQSSHKTYLLVVTVFV